MDKNQMHVTVSATNHVRLQELADVSSISVDAALNVVLTLALAITPPAPPSQPAPTPVVEAQSDWLSPTQLAEYLQIPLGTIYAWRTHGKGPHGHKIGNHVRYSRADINTWLDANVMKRSK